MQKGVAVSPKSSYHIGVVRDIDRQNKIAKAAREAGEAAGRAWGIQLGIEIGMKRAGELMARELHNFKFPDGKIDHENDALKQYAPKDDSTFEFSYQTYEERVKEREAAQRNVRRRRSNRMVAKNRRARHDQFIADHKSNDDHGYDELLAEEGVYVKE
jgi:hypothetical protein